MADHKTPLSISIITILMYISAILDIAGGLFVVLDKNGLADAATAAGLDISSSTFLYSGIFMIAIGVIVGLLANALRSGSNGVRMFIGVIAGIRLLAAVYVIFAVPPMRFQAIGAGIVLAIVLYFLYVPEDSKEFFA